MNIFVGNLSKETTEEELKSLFSAIGNVSSVKVIKDMFSQESKGFGFVEMPGVADAQKAIKELSGKDLNGKSLVVNEARPKTEGGRRNDRNSGGGNRFGMNNNRRFR